MEPPRLHASTWSHPRLHASTWSHPRLHASTPTRTLTWRTNAACSPSRIDRSTPAPLFGPLHSPGQYGGTLSVPLPCREVGCLVALVSRCPLASACASSTHWAMLRCGAAMRCRHAVSPCGAAMRCRHAVPPCGARHAEPVIWLCTQGVTSEIDAEDDSTIVVECTASSGLWIHAKGGLASLRAAHAPCDHHTSSCDSAPRDAASLSFPAECSPSSDPRAARARRRAAHTRPVTRQYRRRTTRLTFNAYAYAYMINHYDSG